MAKSTELVNKVIQSLERIQRANGYTTDAGLAVVRGRPERLELHQDDLPLIAVSSPANTNEAVKPRQVRKEREITITGMIHAEDADYEPQLDDLDEDITLALAALTGLEAVPDAISVEIAGGTYGHPAAGSNIAEVTHTVTVRYLLTNKTNHED